MRTILGILLAAFWLTASGAATKSYDYPFDNPFVATVVGTPLAYQAKLPAELPLQQDAIRVFKDRHVPDVFWYDAQLRYSYALQKRRAPLVFLIPGTGGAHNGNKIQMMARAYYQAGFHVVALSSPTHPNFIVAASRTGVPGHAFYDAEDLYRVMERIWATLDSQIEVTDFFIAGYSLGAFNTAFVTWLDDQRQVFKFKKALLINAPLRLYGSISLLDRMLENIPGGEDNFTQYYQKLLERFSEAYQRSDQLQLNEDFLYKAYATFRPKDEQLAALIGVAFRVASANLAFTADVVTNFGYIKPKNLYLTKNTSLTTYSRVSLRLGFTDYFHDFFYPYYQAKEPTLTRAALIEQMSLVSIEDYLRTADKIELMHNADDLILEPGEIDFFRRVFGARATNLA